MAFLREQEQLCCAMSPISLSLGDVLSPGRDCGEEDARMSPTSPTESSGEWLQDCTRTTSRPARGAGPWARTQPWLWIAEHSPW